MRVWEGKCKYRNNKPSSSRAKQVKCMKCNKDLTRITASACTCTWNNEKISKVPRLTHTLCLWWTENSGALGRGRGRGRGLVQAQCQLKALAARLPPATTLRLLEKAAAIIRKTGVFAMPSSPLS